MNFFSASKKRFCFFLCGTRQSQFAFFFFDCAFRAGRYSGVVSDEKKAEKLRVGLCLNCRHMRRMESDRGSMFYLCGLSATDSRFPKYPRLPVLACAGYEAA